LLGKYRLRLPFFSKITYIKSAAIGAELLESKNPAKELTLAGFFG